MIELPRWANMTGSFRTLRQGQFLQFGSEVIDCAQKMMNRLLKESGFKGKTQYMDEKYRIESKSIDELQTLFQYLRSHKDMNLELNMENLKR